MNEKEKEAYITYLKNRKSSAKTNYYVESIKEMKNIKASTNEKPKLLLHACCIVCACKSNFGFSFVLALMFFISLRDST